MSVYPAVPLATIRVPGGWLAVACLLLFVQAGEAARVTSVSKASNGTYSVMLYSGATQVVPVNEGRMIALAAAGDAEIGSEVMAGLIAARADDGARAQALLAVALYEGRFRADAVQWTNAVLFATLRAAGSGLVQTSLAAELVRVARDLGPVGTNGLFTGKPVAASPQAADVPRAPHEVVESAATESDRVGEDASDPVSGLWLLSPEPSAQDAFMPSPPVEAPPVEASR